MVKAAPPNIINLSFSPSYYALGKHREEPFQLPLDSLKGGIVVNAAPPSWGSNSIIKLSFNPSDDALGKHTAAF